ncbi:hypothetical protein DFJ63DRAFT_314721 [Scheffersomyces coipomensis]|uniref:uncharacterized protein n=1 Tax=Scheffersomyces coipomensis TaxID=1788519 RepID=UPI00315D2FA3
MKILNCIIILILTAFVAAEDRQLDLAGLENTPSSSLNKLSVQPLDRDELENHPRQYLGDDAETTIIYKMNDYNDDKYKNIILHSSVLNTAERLSGNEFAVYTGSEDSRWIEFRTDYYKTKFAQRVAISPCLDETKGKGGSLSGSLSMYFGKTSSIDFTYGGDLLFGTSINMDWKPEVSSTFTTTGSYSCKVPAGKVGQIHMSPMVYEAIDAQVRNVTFTPGYIYDGLAYSEWETKDLSYPTSNSSPKFFCVTSDKCTNIPFEESYTK